MAVDFVVPDMTRTSEYLAYPEHIEAPAGMNGRHELPDITALVDSIITHGQLQPVTIRQAAKKPILVAGFSRWRAVSHINANLAQWDLPKPLKLRCSYTQLTEQQAFLANIEENRVRNATTPMDDAYNIQRLINVYQMTEHDAAKAYRASVSWVRSTLKLLELTPEAEVAVRSGRVKPSAAKAIAKLSAEHQRRVVKREGTITAADVKSETQPAAPKAPTVNVKAAVTLLQAEMAMQPDAMTLEIHRDVVRDILAALGVS